MQFDPALTNFAGPGNRVYLDGSGQSRKLYVSDGRHMVGTAIPDMRPVVGPDGVTRPVRLRSEDIIEAILRLDKHLQVLEDAPR